MTATTTGGLRVLGSRDLSALSVLLARDPIAHCFVSSRLEGSGMDAWRLGGEVWGWCEDGVLVSALYLGANLIPVETTPAARVAFADHAARVGRRCSSIVGPADEVLALWALLEPAWGPAREVRERQPLLAIETAPLVRPDPAVWPLRPAELDAVLPACVAMFTEEVGVSPLAGGGAEPYRARVAEMLRRGRAFGRIEQDRVVFKAELGAVSAAVCQVQGVWIDPELRGQGLAAPALAAVVAQAYRLAPVVSLYVNDFNRAARAAYARVGFGAVGTFATVLF